MMNEMGDFGWLPGFGWIFMLLFWGLVILGIVAIVKWLASAGPSGNTPKARAALDILEERYARGEIDRDEFEQKKRDLAR
ncbi:MAG: SHOCT domain-containing protein [Gammaproteobacteria bacterium]|nr:SHOCT domain-containing protein [Gammaproteobacteria bacterium]